MFNQRYNAQHTDMVESNLLPAAYVPIILTDEKGIKYNLLVTNEEAEQANKGFKFYS